MTASKRTLRELHDYCHHAVGRDEGLPDYFRLLHSWVGCEHGAYFAANGEGELTESGYHEEASHAELAAEFVRRTRQTDASEAATAPSVKAIFRQPLPIEQLHFDSPAARETGFYQELIRHIDGRHILRVGVLDGHRPLGLLTLVRGRHARGFQQAEIDRAVLAAAPLARMMAAPRRSEGAQRLLIAEGVLLLSPQGRLRQACAEGARLWQLAQNHCFLDQHDGDSTLFELCADLRRQGSGNLRRRLGNGWGAFELEATTLSGIDGQPGDIHLRLRHWTLARLRHLRHMQAAGLSSAQKRVCLAMLEDCSQADIASRYGIGVQTSISHIRAVYDRLGVSSRGELRRLFGCEGIPGGDPV